MKDKFIKVYPKDIKKYGTTKAILLGLIQGWCEWHKKEGNKLTNAYWSGYLTYDMISEQTGIPKYTVKKNMKSLHHMGAITYGHFSKLGYDRRRWYRRMDDDHYKGDQNGPMEGTNMVPNRDQNGPMEGTKLGLTITKTSSNNSKKKSTENHTSMVTSIENQFYKQWLNAENNDTKELCLGHLKGRIAGGRTKKNSKDYQSILEGIQLIEEQLKTV